jgi:hypothetical protein
VPAHGDAFVGAAGRRQLVVPTVVNAPVDATSRHQVRRLVVCEAGVSVTNATSARPLAAAEVRESPPIARLGISAQGNVCERIGDNAAGPAATDRTSTLTAVR